MPLKAQQVSDLMVVYAFKTPNYELLTNLKAQKLLYYAQGTFLREKAEPLFEDELQAWEFGPVQPSVYHHYKQFDRNPIPIDTISRVNDIEAEYKKHVAAVMEKFGKYSASYLVSLSHKDKPWLDFYNTDSKNIVIPVDSMGSFFKDHYLFDDDDGALDPTEYCDEFAKELYASIEEADKVKPLSADALLESLDI